MTRCLVLTPAARFGSWTRIEGLIRAAPEIEWLIVSYGRPTTTFPNARFFSLPGLDYTRLARFMSRRRYLALNVAYAMPLMALAWIVGLVYRPRILLGNGLVASVALNVLKWPGRKLIVLFCGYIADAGPSTKRLMRRFLRPANAAIVNSTGSLEDLAAVIDRRKIVVLPNWAEPEFFETDLKRNGRHPFVVLYVGRLDTEKFSQCLRVAGALADRGVVELWAAGAGPLENDVRAARGTRLFMYVEDRRRLASIYAAADVVWAPADSTYLSSPGIEGLASGCPLIVSDVPAVDARAEQGIRIPKDLLPEELGAVVDGTDDREALEALEALAERGIPPALRERCRQFAAASHSSALVRGTLESLGV